MDDARAYLVGRLLRILVLAFALWLAIETLDLRGPDPDVPRYVLEPAEHELGSQSVRPVIGAAPYRGSAVRTVGWPPVRP
jgi:hypothetical protein